MTGTRDAPLVLPSSWPPALIGWVQAQGQPECFERLEGMSVASVCRVRFAAGSSVVVKVSPRGTEWAFYTRIADTLRAAGVPIPDLYWASQAEGLNWLVLEDLPQPLPVDSGSRWAPDAHVVQVLADLHRATHGWDPGIEPRPRLSWTAKTTEAALGCFPHAVAGSIQTELERIRKRAMPLTAEWCWISGDASPANWGRRADGSLVLFDWELFRPGIPASDLAPVVPGLPGIDDFEETAEAYASAWMGPRLPWTARQLARDTAVAKVATVVTLLAAHATGTANVPDGYAADLVARVPAWLMEIGAKLA